MTKKRVVKPTIRKGTIKLSGVPRVTAFHPQTYMVEFILNEDTLTKLFARKLVGRTLWECQRDLVKIDCLVDQYAEAYRVRIITKDSKGIETQTIVDNEHIDKEETLTQKTIIP